MRRVASKSTQSMQSMHPGVHLHTTCLMSKQHAELCCLVGRSLSSGDSLTNVIGLNGASNTPRGQKQSRHSSSNSIGGGSTREDCRIVSILKTGDEAFDREEQSRYQVCRYIMSYHHVVYCSPGRWPVSSGIKVAIGMYGSARFEA